MTECFKKAVVAKVEPSYICKCITAYKDKLLIGTKQGVILVYSVSFNVSNLNSNRQESLDKKITTTFCVLIRDFNKKPIKQIEVVEEFKLLLTVADGKLYVHRLSDYRLLYLLENVKGISEFCYDVYDPNQLAQEDKLKKKTDMMHNQVLDESILARTIISENSSKEAMELRVCIISKVKLQILKWNPKLNRMEPGERDYKLPTTPKFVMFFFDDLFIGSNIEYSLVNIETSYVNVLFSVGKCQEPFAFRVSDLLGIKIDETVEFIDRKGNLFRNSTLRWSMVPSYILYHPPFAIAILNKFIEVRMVQPTMLIQTLQMDCANLICHYHDRVYVMLDNNKVSCLIGTPRTQLVQSFSETEDFEIALMLAKTSSLVGESNIDSTKINIQYAMSLYKNHQFEHMLNIFMEINIDPSHVLSLFPVLCPEKMTKDLKKDLSQNFSKDEESESIRALINYLVKWRSKTRKIDNESPLNCLSIQNGTMTDCTKKQIQQIVDTSLLKCYLIIKSPLVGPLLRQENFCHHDETKKWLLNYEKYQELILLYENKKMHSDALSLLHSQSVKSHSPLEGLSPTIQYLKNLDPYHLDLVYQYGDVILAKQPMEWLAIFIHWDQKLKNDENVYPRYKDRLVKHLQTKSMHMVIPFLERMIFKVKDDEQTDDEEDGNERNDRKVVNRFSVKSLSGVKLKLIPLDLSEELPFQESPNDTNTPDLHNSYIQELIKQILRMRQVGMLCIKIKDEMKSPALDAKEVYDLRIRLKRFLQSDKAQYWPSKILNELPYDALYEERACVLARDEKHEQALTLWIHLFKDWEQVIDHCTAVYSKHPDIYFTLLKICIEPSEPSALGIVLPTEFLGFDSEVPPMRNSVSGAKFPPLLDRAIFILNRYSDKLSPIPTLKLLSGSNMLTIKNLIKFIMNALRNQTSVLNQIVLLRNIQFYHKISSNLRSCESARHYFLLTEQSFCSVCNRQMGSSAVVRYPNGSLVHYGCCKDLPK